MSPQTKVSLAISLIMLLGGVYLWVMRFGGVLPLETCLQTNPGITCSGVWSWEVYSVVMWPLLMGYWMVRLYRWGVKRGAVS